MNETTEPLADHVAIARLYGEPLFQAPQDLYIPPDALEIFLEAFEGPLDLLLYLIRKQGFNIFDIPMAEVTRQYLGYIEQVRRTNLELAAEYLLMAALLIEIKSRMLLPQRPKTDEEEAEDPRAVLVQRLLEYERMKRAAQRLEFLAMIGRDFWRASALNERPEQKHYPDVSGEDLRRAWLDIARRQKLNASHRLPPEQLSVREYMSRVLRHLAGQRFVEFHRLFLRSEGAGVAVVTFLAILELVRESLVEATQASAYAPLYVRLSYRPS